MESSTTGVLKIYASSTDKVGSKLLYDYIVHEAKEAGIAGVTVYRGIMGFGMSSKISSSKFWELTEKLPIVIEIIDKTRILEEFYRLIEDDLESMGKGCLVVIEPVYVLMKRSGKNK